MKNEEIATRLTRLETLDAARGKKQDEINSKLDKLTTRFDRYEAKWGGVVMVISALAAVFSLLKGEIKRWFGYDG